LFIPYIQVRYGNGGIGAAIATTMTELCVMLVSLYIMPRQILRGFRLSVVVKSVLAGLMAGAVIFPVRHTESIWIVAMCLAPVVFVVALFAMRTFEPAEDSFLRSILSVRSVEQFRNLIGKKDPASS
jgi:hypothetical protein